PAQHRQNNADQKAGDNRKMERDILAAVINIPRQLSKPAPAHATPKHKADDHNRQASYHQKLSNLRHISMILHLDALTIFAGLYQKAARRVRSAPSQRAFDRIF